MFSNPLSDVPFKYQIKHYPFLKTILIPQTMKVILRLFLQRMLCAQKFFTVQHIARSMYHSRQHSKHLLRVCYVPGIPHEKINKIELMSTKLQRDIQVTNLDYGECKIDSERREVICWLILSPEGLAKASQSSYHLI